MKLIGNIQTFDINKIKIEGMHRTAIGLLSGTEVFLSRLPSRNINGHVELLLTTIPPTKWNHLCKVTAKLKDSPGVVADAVNALVSSNCNILIIETLTTAGQSEHELLAFVSPIQHSAFRTTKLKIKKELAKKLGDAIIQVDIQELTALKRSAELRRANGIEKESISTKIERFGINSNPAELENLFPFTKNGNRLIPSRFLCYSDTEEKYMCMYFPPDDAPIAQITVDHSEEPGAIDAFALIFKQHKANILTSFSRLKRTGELAQWSVVVDLSDVVSAGQMLKEMSSSIELFKGFSDLRVSYTSDSLQPVTDTNPFHFTDEQNWDETFVGREDIRNAILGSYEECKTNAKTGKGVPNNFLVSGYYKTGKSTVLRHVESSLSIKKHVLPVFWNVKGIPASRFWSQLVEDLYTGLFKRFGMTKSKAGRDFKTQLKTWGESIKSFRIFFTQVNLNDMKADEPEAYEIKERLRVLVDYAYEKGIERIVVLFDEGQSLLSGSESNNALDVLHIIEQEIQAINWIVATSDRWKGNQGRDGFVAKMRELRMKPLKSNEAKELLNKTFKSRNKYLPRLLRKRIVNISGCQPCYLQAIGSAVFDRIATGPKVVDVVDENVLDLSLVEACWSLHSHFSEMQKSLLEVFSDVAVKKILENPNRTFPLAWFRQNAKPSTTPSSFYLDVIPGLSAKRDNAGKPTGFSVNPLFHHWSQTVINSSTK